ncbi:M23 family metallopeptidase [Roseitalea porphyridii]|jgi:murein DD-endopeptidase MepM/ murein hydrolase activator NlpD|uniref:M23 family metallopeptidase n=1 Tax=Roseitalea porphyridii TaxID=1852022 RepID=UPI0032EFA70D
MTAKPHRQGDLVGDEPAIAGTARRAPDRREISLRWLTGTFLTGLTSTTLMGAALFAALDGKQFLATPPEVASRASHPHEDAQPGVKTARLVGMSILASEPPSDRRRMSVSTVTRTSDADVVRTRPFEHLSITLAAARSVETEYPPFNPLTIFSESGETEPEPAEDLSTRSLIYGASIETGASIRVTDFVFNDEETYDTAFEISLAEAEEAVRERADVLIEGAIEVASLHYVDPRRFGVDDPLLAGIASTGAQARIVPQNVSIAEPAEDGTEIKYAEDLIEVHETTELEALMESAGHPGGGEMAQALATLLNATSLRGGHTIRLGLLGEGQAEAGRVIRATVYAGRDHVLTIALNDQEQFVPAPEPVDSGIMRHARQQASEPAPPPRDMPSIYDAIYRGVLAYELPQSLAAQIVRMVAADVDFRSPVTPGDSLELFYSVPEEGVRDAAREVLFVRATFGGQSRKFYKFRSADGATDYYDEEGRSARQFLLRNPVPTGKFRSGFGMRRHPILGYSRMHWGADWAAPRGTPIIAPGHGTVVKAGWNSGYGKQTVIRHANGYETSYSHQTRFAKGIAAGAKVRQGQVIGYVGSTGLSTGPHLHYEMSVNGKRVDPMRVRLPDGKTLSGAELVAFTRERDRINTLLEIDLEETTEVASADG